MKRCVLLGLVLTMGTLLASAPSLARGYRWHDHGDRPSWQYDSDRDHHRIKKKSYYKSKKKSHHKSKKKNPVDPSVPEPTGALVFAAGMLAVQRATRRRR